MGTDQATGLAELRRLLYGNRATHLIHAAAELALADLLAAGPQSSGELARRAGAHRDALHRALRGLTQLGVFAQLDDGRFALTPLGECLRSDHPRSLRDAARVWGHESHARPWADLLPTVATGEPAFRRLFGTDLFSYLARDPRLAARFNEGLARGLAARNAPVVAAYDFGGLGLIADVGSGLGGLLLGILATAPRARGIVFDLPHCEPDVARAVAAAGLADRCRFVGGDFFAAVPPGADAYLLRHVLSDWDDERAVAILASCRRAAPPAGRLLVIGWLPPADEPWPADVVWADVNLMAVPGGRERTAEEYGGLLARAGWRAVRVVPTELPAYAIIEAAPT